MTNVMDYLLGMEVQDWINCKRDELALIVLKDFEKEFKSNSGELRGIHISVLLDIQVSR